MNIFFFLFSISMKITSCRAFIFFLFTLIFSSRKQLRFIFSLRVIKIGVPVRISDVYGNIQWIFMIPAFGYEKRLYSVLMLSSPLSESIGLFGRYRTANQSVIYFAHSQMFGMFCVYRLYQFRVYALASSLPYRERHSVNTMPNISNQTQNTHHNVTWYITHWIFFGRHTQTPIRNVIRNTNTNSRCNAKKKNLLVQVCFLLIYAIRIWCCFDLLCLFSASA